MRRELVQTKDQYELGGLKLNWKHYNIEILRIPIFYTREGIESRFAPWWPTNQNLRGIETGDEPSTW